MTELDAGLLQRAAAKAQVFVADVASPVLTADDDHHLARVLRLRAGEPIVVANGSGAWAMASYTGLGAPVTVTSDVTVEPASTSPITVAFAPVKGDRPEWAFAKLVELGVDTICLLVADRSVVRWGDERAERHRLRLDKIAVAVAAQCRRVTLPRLVGPMTVAEAAQAVEGLSLCDFDGDAPTASTMALAVGPEGGWSAEERGLGLPRVVLGTTVLRAETACVAAGTVLGLLRSGLVGPAATS